jgi:hypothetical protein
MQMDEMFEDQNALTPMNESFEPDSNVTAESTSHARKQESPSFVTLEGMQIDESDEHL